jgi:hypothetical protein
MPKRLLLLLALVPSQPAYADDFACRNDGAETICTRQLCATSADGFTPMSLRRTGQRVELCAYSDCFSGPIRVQRTLRSMTLLAADIRGRDGARTPLAVIYDARTRSASIQWHGFANAMHCAAPRRNVSGNTDR